MDAAWAQGLSTVEVSSAELLDYHQNRRVSLVASGRGSASSCPGSVKRTHFGAEQGADSAGASGAIGQFQWSSPIICRTSSMNCSKEIATALRGRGWRILLHTFSFEEVLRHGGTEAYLDGSRLTARVRSRMERAYIDWLVMGGFPEAQGLEVPVRRQLLRDYVDVAMFRDVVERHNVRNVTGLRWLVRQLLGNAGSLFSVEKFYASLKSQGIAISKDYVHQLLGYLDDCFLVRVIWMESVSERQRMVNPRKAYPVDTGLIPILDRTGRANLGHALETAVFVELERRGCEITYVRSREGFEVDFLARGPRGEADLIQVCTDLSDPATAEREIRALQAAGAAIPDARKLVLTLTADGFPQEVPAGVSVQTAWEWSLGSLRATVGSQQSGGASPIQRPAIWRESVASIATQVVACSRNSSSEARLRARRC